MSKPPVPDYVEGIRSSGLTIYDLLDKNSPLYIPTLQLESILDAGLHGFSLAGLPLRTRSKVAKGRVCEILGYPAPKSFKKCKPHARFPGQNFDTYVQAANNLQVWNAELQPRRRYVLIRQDGEGLIQRVKVVTGLALAKLDTTGTLTQKYQARFSAGANATDLFSPVDTSQVTPLLMQGACSKMEAEPTDAATVGELKPIAEIFRELSPLVGNVFPDAGHDQERNRGAALHRLVCTSLGYQSYADDGQFPDIRHQLLEVKLQTGPTIDLGLVQPVSTEPLDLDGLPEGAVRHCDVRYAIFGACTDGHSVTLKNLVLATGEGFFSRFPQFGGRVLNKKLQIPLPRDFFGKPKR